MSVVMFLLVGLVAGWLSSSLVKGHGQGILGNLIVGVIGSLVGGFFFDLFGITAYGLWGALVTSIVGAVLLLLALGLFIRPYRLRTRADKL